MIDSPASAAEAGHAKDPSLALKEASLIGAPDPDDVTPCWRRRPSKWGPAQRFQATHLALAAANAAAFFIAFGSKGGTGFVLTHAVTRPAVWTDGRLDELPKLMVTTETPQRAIELRAMTLWAFFAGVFLNLLPVSTQRMRNWSYESLVQKTAPVRALDVASALAMCAVALTAASGVREGRGGVRGVRRGVRLRVLHVPAGGAARAVLRMRSVESRRAKQVAERDQRVAARCWPRWRSRSPGACRPRRASRWETSRTACSR